MPEQTYSVRNTHWENIGSVKALCDGCLWQKLAGQGVAVAAAKRHALVTGHRVQLVRRQERWTIPEDYRS